jgi:deferrochelatase/peroxidase EfeB
MADTRTSASSVLLALLAGGAAAGAIYWVVQDFKADSKADAPVSKRGYHRNPATPKKSLHERIVDAEARATSALANYNESVERGNMRAAQKWWDKAQFWLDRANTLTGRGAGPAPSR